MTTLVITDLKASKELDSKAMAGVYGGTGHSEEAMYEMLAGFGILIGSSLNFNDADDTSIGIDIDTTQVAFGDRSINTNNNATFVNAQSFS